MLFSSLIIYFTGLKNSIKLYSQSDLKSGKIYESLSKGISFIPIIYIFGYVYMIYKAHEQQKKEFENDPELRSYYKSVNKKKS